MMDENGLPSIRINGSKWRSSLILTIWAEAQADGSLVWRGCFQTSTGQRLYFGRLESLTELLMARGWSDPT